MKIHKLLLVVLLIGLTLGAPAKPALAQGDCSAPLGLAVGALAQVGTATSLPNNLRSGPGRANPVIEIAQPGATFTIVGAPQCADGYNWWQVQMSDSGNVGWMAEGTPADYWIEAAGSPVVPSTGDCPLPLALLPGMQGQIAAGFNVDLMQQPHEVTAILRTLPGGTPFTLLSGPACLNGTNMWQVRLDSGEVGWIGEGAPGAYHIAIVSMPLPTPPVVAGFAPLPGPPAAIPAGMRPLYILTQDSDGTLGQYRSGMGWGAVTGFSGVARHATFAQDAVRRLVLLAADDLVQAVDVDNAITVLSFNWTSITGRANEYIRLVYPAADNTSMVAEVRQLAEAYEPMGLYRIDPFGLVTEELVPMGWWGQFAGVSGMPPRFLVTATRITALTPEGRLGDVVLTYAEAPSFSETPFIPRLTFAPSGMVAYLVMPQNVDTTAMTADLVYWRISEGVGGFFVEEMFRLAGQDVFDVGQAAVSLNGRYLAVQESAPTGAALRVVDVTTGTVVATHLGDFFAIQWTPDSLGFIARESAAGDAYRYYGLDGSTTSPYLPGVPNILRVTYLADGTVLFWEKSAADAGRWDVQRPGQPPFALREDTNIQDALLLPAGP